jgi:hypothetical protein
MQPTSFMYVSGAIPADHHQLLGVPQSNKETNKVWQSLRAAKLNQPNTA